MIFYKIIDLGYTYSERLKKGLDFMPNMKNMLHKVVKVLQTKSDTIPKGLKAVYDDKDKALLVENSDKFMPTIYCKATLDQSASHLTMTCNLPLVQLVQKMAKKNIYLDDIKVKVVSRMAKKLATDNGLTIQTKYATGTWVSYPRSLSIKSNLILSSKDKVSNLVVMFTQLINDIMNNLEKHYTKYLVVSDITETKVSK